MARLLVLGNWHSGSSCASFAHAAEQEGHTVIRVGPAFAAMDQKRWWDAISRMRWCATGEAESYAADVFRQSPRPDVVTEKGEHIAALPEWDDVDAQIDFWAYGETPRITEVSARYLVKVPSALVIGDTHTGHLAEQRRRASDDYDHLFVQFRPGDLEAFDHPSKHWLPPAADPDIWKPDPDQPKLYDVALVASTDPAVHTDRVKLVEYLREQGINVAVFHRFGPAAAEVYNRSRVVLNRSLAGDINLRVPEALMAGACLVTDRVEGLGDFCVRGYDSPADCIRTIREALQNPEEWAKAAALLRGLALDNHTWRHRVRQVLETMGVRDGDKDRRGGGGHPAGGGRDRIDVVNPDRVAGRAVAAGSVGAPSAPAGSIESDAPARVAARPVADCVGGGDGDLAPDRVVDEAAPRPSVSIIVPAYGHAEMTFDLAVSLVYADHEVIVVDDGSPCFRPPRNTGRVLLVTRHQNGGFAAACNTGAAAARGEVLVFLNNDTEPEPGWLAPLVAAAQEGHLAGALILNPDGSVQSAGLYQGDDGEWSNATWNYSPTYPPDDQYAVMGACLAIRRDTFWRLGGFDEGFPSGCEDVDLCLRAGAAGLRVVLVPQSRVRHAEGTTRRELPDVQEKIARSQQRLRERWEGTPDGHPASDPDPDRASASAAPGLRPGPVDGRGGRALGAPGHRTPASSRAPLTFFLDGPLDARIGGSLAVVNRGLLLALGDRPEVQGTVLYRETADVWLSHSWTGLEHSWPPPPPEVKHWVILADWEGHVMPAPEPWKRVLDEPRFRCLVLPSSYSRGLLIASGWDADKLRVVPYGVDDRVFCPGDPGPYGDGSEDDDVYRVLFVGGLLERKGVEELYAAWKMAFTPDEDVVLVLKMQGRRSFYEGQFLHPPPGFSNVMLLDGDGRSPAWMARLYRQASVVCQPYRHEGFCLPLLEALACGVPVIYPAWGPAPEFVPPEAGLRLPDAQPATLARALRYLYEHPEVRRKMGSKAAAGMTLTWSFVAHLWVKLLREVCHE